MMNDKTKLVKEAKNDKASRCCWSAYQKKIRQNGIRRNGIRRNAIRQNATQPHLQPIKLAKKLKNFTVSASFLSLSSFYFLYIILSFYFSF